MRIFHSLGHVFGGSLLIAGTMVGVGMLALPVATGEGGFFPAVAIYLLCWLFMLCTGLLLLEVCSWMPKEANLITMAERLPRTDLEKIFAGSDLPLSLHHRHDRPRRRRRELSSAKYAAARFSPWASMIIYVVLFSPVV